MKTLVGLGLLAILASAVAAREPGSDITDEEINVAIAAFVKAGYSGDRIADPALVDAYSDGRERVAKALEELKTARVGRGTDFASRREVAAEKMKLEIMDEILAARVKSLVNTKKKWHVEYLPITKHSPIESSFYILAPLRIVDIIDSEFVHAVTTVLADKYTRVAVRLWPDNDRYNDQVIDVRGRVFMDAGTYRYDTVIGGTNTLPHLIDVTERLKKYIDEHVPAEDRHPLSSPVTEGISRTWKSADRKFAIDAQFVSAGESNIVLRKADGSEIEVKLSLLSIVDQMWVSAYDAAVASISSNGDVTVRESAGQVGGYGDLGY